MASSQLQLLPSDEHKHNFHDVRPLRVYSRSRGTLDIHDDAANQATKPDAASGMPPLMMTKVRIPAPGSGLLIRDRLVVQVMQGAQQALTLVIAPAGYGKTTLLNAWARQSNTPVAWVSLDANDDVPQRFWAYIIAALDAAQPGVGARVQPVLDMAMDSIEQMLAMVINNLATALPMTLVLDDYHLIHNDTIHQSLAVLLNHLPDTLHLVIISRSEPPLPLAHWRAADTLTEVGVADLRFTQEEATTLITETMPLPLTGDGVATLLERTEGWAAGLRLAARAARTNTDMTRLVHDFHGGHRDIQDYLDQEVFDLMPADMLAFVLQTAVLDQLCAPLCAALCDPRDWLDAAIPPERADPTQHEDHLDTMQSLIHVAQDMLVRIERAGLFVIPLDTERVWYRYHTLFAEAIRHRLNQAAPELAAVLRQRAAAWYIEHCASEQMSIDQVPLNHAYFKNPVSEELILSKREREVLRLLADGATNQEIALMLIIGVNTVKMHIQHLYDKLDVHNRVQAIQRARALGIL